MNGKSCCVAEKSGRLERQRERDWRPLYYRATEKCWRFNRRIELEVKKIEI